MIRSLEEFMVFLKVEKSRLSFVKTGRISIHETTLIGKKYVRGKIYLKNDKNIGDRYQLFEVEDLHLVERNNQYRKGTGYIIFISN